MYDATGKKTTDESKAVRKKVLEINDHPEKKAEQNHINDCCIENIIARSSSDELLKIKHNVDNMQPVDLTQAPADLQSSMNFVINAQQSFEQYPKEIKNRFNNNIQQFYQFVTNPDNADECRQLGLLPPLEAQPVSQTTPTEPAPADTTAPDATV